ncbi:MAG: dialkylresorcinol condensing enzyme, partial [Kangiellaceae bacterium]
FLATPLWMFTGRKKAYSWTPKAGVSEDDIKNASRFGDAIVERLNSNSETISEPILKNMGAVTVNEKFIASERVGQHSFKIWSRIISSLGPMYSTRRSLGLIVYITFLLTLILTVVPLFAIVKRIISPFTRKKILQQRAYFAEPSGE